MSGGNTIVPNVVSDLNVGCGYFRADIDPIPTWWEVDEGVVVDENSVHGLRVVERDGSITQSYVIEIHAVTHKDVAVDLIVRSQPAGNVAAYVCSALKIFKDIVAKGYIIVAALEKKPVAVKG